MAPTSAIDPQRTVRSPNSWADGIEVEGDDGDRHGGDECIEGRRPGTAASALERATLHARPVGSPTRWLSAAGLAGTP